MTLDVVVPLYNEEEMVDVLVATLRQVFCEPALAAHGVGRVRFLMIDDGSSDRTAERLRRHIQEALPAVLYVLSRNFGHQNAVSAGLDRADADVVAVMDGDLQDPPELILQMIDKWREGFEVVLGRRTRRKEGPLKRLAYWSFYRLLSLLAEVTVPLDAGDFSLMDARVVQVIRRLPESQRFIRCLRAWVGFRQTEIRYERPARRAGSSKYSFRDLYDLATNGLASLSIRPLRIAQFFGILFAALSILLGTLLALSFAFSGPPLVPPVILGLLLLITLGNFVQTSCIYVLGAYVGRAYLETKQRPPYVVWETFGAEAGSPPAGAPEAGRRAP